MSQVISASTYGGSQYDKGGNVEDIKDSIRIEIRKELKIKEGAENLRKVSTDKRTLTQCHNAIKEASQKLNQLQANLQELNLQITEEVFTDDCDDMQSPAKTIDNTEEYHNNLNTKLTSLKKTTRRRDEGQTGRRKHATNAPQSRGQKQKTHNRN